MYKNDSDALHAYARAQSVVFRHDFDLSTYRIRFQDVPHVVVVGLAPSPEVDSMLEAILAGGDAAELPAHIIQTLLDRRGQAERIGPWVEGHYRPGKPM